MPSNPLHSSIEEYEKFIDENSLAVKNIQVGKFYSYAYDFQANPYFHTLPQQISGYYDAFPLTFMYSWYTTKDDRLYYRGINLHHIPVNARKSFMRILTEMFDLKRENKNHAARIMLNWTMIEELCAKFNPKLTIALRQYHPDRIEKLVQIDSKVINEALRFTAPTYHLKNYRHILQRYNTWQPKV